MINRLDHYHTDINDVIGKINEIIDFLNDTYLMKVKDGQYGTLTLAGDNLIAFDNVKSVLDNTTTTLGYDAVKCPHCGKSYYTELHSESTCVYYPPIWKDGVNINPDRNKLTTHCKCLYCGKEFDI